MDRPIETRTISESATISLEFVIQEDTKGRYKIVRDGVTIIDKEVPYQHNNNTFHFLSREWNVLLCLLCCLHIVDCITGKIYDSKSYKSDTVINNILNLMVD